MLNTKQHIEPSDMMDHNINTQRSASLAKRQALFYLEQGEVNRAIGAMRDYHQIKVVEAQEKLERFIGKTQGPQPRPFFESV